MFTRLFPLFGVLFVCLKVQSNRVPRIALATQGKADEVSRWFQLFSLMENKAHVTLFVLSYDVAVNSTNCGNDPKSPINCIFHPQSTWTSGRNVIAQNIIKHERDNQHPFKYWVMTDWDQSMIGICGKTTKCHAPKYAPKSIEFAACCFDAIIENLSKPTVQYPIIHYYTLLIEPICALPYSAFLHYDCGDGMLYAYHRHAVPVVFPMIELLDKTSWWESQGIHFHLVSGCFPGYSVYSNLVCEYGSNAHTGYPQGRRPVESKRAMERVYGTGSSNLAAAGLIPEVISLKLVTMEQGNCANLPANTSHTTNFIEHQHSTFNSAGWQNLTSFKACQNTLRPRFLKYVETGDLSKIDGDVY